MWAKIKHLWVNNKTGFLVGALTLAIAAAGIILLIRVVEKL